MAAATTSTQRAARFFSTAWIAFALRVIASLMRSEGMTDGENHRDLLTHLSTALAITEAAYLEAHRRTYGSLIKEARGP
jgi:hypothetical protein